MKADQLGSQARLSWWPDGDGLDRLEPPGRDQLPGSALGMTWTVSCRVPRFTVTVTRSPGWEAAIAWDRAAALVVWPARSHRSRRRGRSPAVSADPPRGDRGGSQPLLACSSTGHARNLGGSAARWELVTCLVMMIRPAVQRARLDRKAKPMPRA